MQRITNCILATENHCLMLQKPSKGWWVAPGGKMEQTETIKETVVREFKEETGLWLMEPALRAVTTTVIVDENKAIKGEWMMFTFQASQYSGKLFERSPEGKLQWLDKKAHAQLPMAEGDHLIFNHVLEKQGLLYSTFYYTTNHQLLDYRIDPS